MTFFNWIPPQDTEMISPWLGLYFGLAAMLTGLTYLWWKRWTGLQGEAIKDELRRELTETDSMIWEFIRPANNQIQGEKISMSV